jgi:hypothetical protein
LIGHFNADDLASYRAGMVSGGRAARIGAHLTSCPQCADVHSGLGDVSQLLASIPVPPMPETLTQRVHAAIAYEAGQRSMATTALGRADGDRVPALIPGRPDLPERGKRPVRRPRMGVWSSPLLLRGLAAAGVLVLLVGGGVLLANQRGVGTASGPAAGAPQNRPVKSRASGHAAVGSTAVTRLPYQRNGGHALTNVVVTDANYTKATLPAGVRREVAHSAQFSTPAVTLPAYSGAPGSREPLQQTTVGQLESCVSTVAAGRLVLLVDLARFLDRPAAIIVIKTVGNAFDVIVVGEACGAASEDLITSLVVPRK